MLRIVTNKLRSKCSCFFLDLKYSSKRFYITFNDREKAQENIYVKQKEAQKLERLKMELEKKKKIINELEVQIKNSSNDVKKS